MSVALLAVDAVTGFSACCFQEIAPRLRVQHFGAPV